MNKKDKQDYYYQRNTTFKYLVQILTDKYDKEENRKEIKVKQSDELI